MPPHPPPCHPNEIRIGDTCYPTPNLHINPLGEKFDFSLSNVHPEVLPSITDMAGEGAEIVVKKAGQSISVTISAVPRADANVLLQALRPNDPDAKLP
jgi:hypothetical protein